MEDDTGKYDPASKINKKLQSYYFNNTLTPEVNFSLNLFQRKTIEIQLFL